MSIFSSKKKTQVHTSVMRAIQDNQVPNTNKQSMIQAIINNEDIGSKLVEGILNGPALKVDRMYEYGKRDYHFGLPNATLLQSTDAQAEVKRIIEYEIGYTIVIDSYHLAPLNHIHQAFKVLTDDYGYNWVTNRIEGLQAQHNGDDCFLRNIIAVHPADDDAEIGSHQSWINGNQGHGQYEDQSVMADLVKYRAHFKPQTSPEGYNQAKVYYDVAFENHLISQEILTLNFDAYEVDREYHQVRYHYTDAHGVVHHRFWTYKDQSGVYPDVDQVMQRRDIDPGSYFPFVFFRHHRQNRATDALRGTPEYETTTKLLSYLNMDFQEMSDQIHANPDIADVEQALLMMGIPATSKWPSDMKYLWEFFSRIADSSPSNTLKLHDPRELPRNSNALVIADADFKVTLSYGEVTRRYKSGRITGLYGLSYWSLIETFPYKTVVVEEHDDGEGGTIRKQHEVTHDIPVLVIRKQTSRVIYEEIRIVNPSSRYDIWKDYSYVGGATDDQLLIPVDKNLIDHWNLEEKEELYFRSLHYVFNSRITTKVKWYETGLFKFLLIVIAIVITIYSGGTAWQGLAAAFASGGLTALAWAAITMIVKTLAVQYGFRLVIDKVGTKLAMIAALVAIAIGMGMQMNAGGLGKSVWADSLVAAGNGLANGVQAETRQRMNEYKAEAQEFELYKVEALKELEEMTKLLETEEKLDPFTFVGREPKVMFGESPESFYQRTIHSGNIGTAIYDGVSNFVELSLQLPDLNNSVGDML